jgi:hypothetical protein
MLKNRMFMLCCLKNGLRPLVGADALISSFAVFLPFHDQEYLLKRIDKPLSSTRFGEFYLVGMGRAVGDLQWLCEARFIHSGTECAGY